MRKWICRDCGKTLRFGDIVIFNMDEDDEFMLCKECASKYEYFFCIACASFRMKEELAYDDGEYQICRRCAEERGPCPTCGVPGGERVEGGCVFCTVICDWCKNRVPKGSHIEIRGWYLCRDCYESGVRVCKKCGELSNSIDPDTGICNQCEKKILRGEYTVKSEKSPQRKFSDLSELYPIDWDEIRMRALERAGYQCEECGATEKLQVHHIIPLSKGGSNDLSNLKVLCERCHALKHPHLIYKVIRESKRESLECEHCHKILPTSYVPKKGEPILCDQCRTKWLSGQIKIGSE